MMSLGHFGNNGKEYLRKKEYKDIIDKIHKLKYATLEPNKRAIQKLQQKLDKMTEEDIKYRQGRSKNQYENSMQALEYLVYTVGITAILFCLYGLYTLATLW